MVRDALIEADAVWNGRLANCIDDPQEFQLITDCILKDVEVSKEPAMAKAQDILRRLRRRQLYGFVDECVRARDATIQPLPLLYHSVGLSSC